MRYLRFTGFSAAIFAAGVGFTAINAGAETPSSPATADTARQQIERADSQVEAARHALDAPGAARETPTSAPPPVTADGADLGPSRRRIQRATRRGEDAAGAASGASARANRVLAAASAFRPAPQPGPMPKDARGWKKIGLSLERAKVVDGRYVVELENGAKATLTLDVELQAYLEKMFVRHKMPHGSTVVLEPETGRVLAMVSHTDAEPALDDLARTPRAPSASVFKVISSAALLEEGKIGPTDKVCYHGGRSRLTERNIKGSKKYDRKCARLGSAIAWSINSIIAKLAYKHLSKKKLDAWVERFGYNSDIPFELPVAKSKAEIVDDSLERARTAAGFWHTYLSPLHGAMIGATIANDGVMMQPSIIERYEHPEREFVYEFEARELRRVVSKKTARRLRKMMKRTTTVGTARRYFKHRKGFPGHITVGGKTGTLYERKPNFLGFTWFVGFASNSKLADHDIAVSGLAVNHPKWRIKGGYAASEAVVQYYRLAERRQREKNQKEKKIALAD
jgi:cell division protein FtsI/penicillin-binding protein 2